MNIVGNMVQGTAAWHELRAQRFTASEAAAALGQHKYMSRSDLLKLKHTGVQPESSASQQRIFNAGHQAEASARPFAEEIIGTELYPCTVEDDSQTYLASMDGLDMLGETGFEHKLASESLLEQVKSGDLEDHYKWQMDHQMMVTGADKILFMASDGGRERCAYLWYERDEERIEQLLAGWAQFRADLAEYQPAEQTVAPQGEAPEALPALKIDLTGAVQASNLPDFKQRALAMIEGIKTELTTDKDFADAESTVKFLQKGEKQLKASKQAALEQTASIAELFDTIDELAETMRQKRLQLDKLVKAEKENRRNDIERRAEQAYDAHLERIEKELEAACSWPINFPAPKPGIAAAMKGKRTMTSLQDAADTAVANGKIQADEVARQVRASIDTLKQEAEGFEALFADGGQLVCDKAPDDLRNLARSRIAEHKEAEAKAAAERQAQQERDQEPAQPEGELQRIDPTDAGMGYTRKPLDTGRITQAADSFQRGSQVAKPETVEITRKEYDALLAARAKLDALEAAGVDNWSGYDDAMAQLEAA